MLDVLTFLWEVAYTVIWVVWAAAQAVLVFMGGWGDTLGPELEKPALLGLAAGAPVREAVVVALRASDDH